MGTSQDRTKEDTDVLYKGPETSTSDPWTLSSFPKDPHRDPQKLSHRDSSVTSLDLVSARPNPGPPTRRGQ